MSSAAKSAGGLERSDKNLCELKGRARLAWRVRCSRSKRMSSQPNPLAVWSAATKKNEGPPKQAFKSRGTNCLVIVVVADSDH